jgi:ADP-heptose:LPS heptosyltransferase
MLKKKNFINRNNFYVVLLLTPFIWIFAQIYKTLLFRRRNINKGRLVFIEYGHLGDALFLTASFKHLREKSIEIICIASKSGSKAFLNNEYISKIVVQEQFDWNNSLKSRIVNFLELIKILKQLNPEFVINVNPIHYHLEALAAFIANIPNRVGFAHRGLGFLLTHKAEYKKETRILQYYYCVRTLFPDLPEKPINIKPEFYRSHKEITNAGSILKSLGMPSLYKIGINITCQHSFQWDLHKYIELCTMIHALEKADILFLGVGFEEQYAFIEKSLPFRMYSLVNKTTLGEIAEIIHTLDLLVTIDTGLRHIANAVNTPCLVIRPGHNSNIEFGKYTDNEVLFSQEVPCSPCGKERCPLKTIACINNVEPADLVKEIAKLLK